jgi:hypothetical protein
MEPEQGKRGRRQFLAKGLSPTSEQLLELFHECKRLLAENEKLRELVAGRPTTHISIQAVSNLTVVVSTEAEVEQITNQISGSVGNLAQGDKAQAINLGAIDQAPSLADRNAYLSELVPALDRLSDAMDKEKSDPEHEADIGMVKAAASAIRKNDTSKAVEFLKRTSKWAIEVATNVGVPLAVEALKQACGIPR